MDICLECFYFVEDEFLKPAFSVCVPTLDDMGCADLISFLATYIHIHDDDNNDAYIYRFIL